MIDDEERPNGVGGEASACLGKVAYATRAEAQRNIEHVKRRAPSRTRCEVYQCAHCRLYHVGNKVRRTAKIRRVFNLVHR